MTQSKPVYLTLPRDDAAEAHDHLASAAPGLLITRELAKRLRRRVAACEECGEQVVMIRDHLRFCSAICRNRAWRAEHGKAVENGPGPESYEVE